MGRIQHLFFKKYLEKSYFPKSQLLTGFEAITTKFKSKDEDAYTLQFKNSILSVGILTYGLTSIVETNFKIGELIGIIYEGFFTWKKNKKTLVFLQKPCNFSDV